MPNRPPIKRVYRVDSGPLVKWMNERVTKYNTVKEFAEHVEQEHSWINKLLTGKLQTVELKKVDIIICRDDTIHLRELYPYLYDEEHDAAA